MENFKQDVSSIETNIQQNPNSLVDLDEELADIDSRIGENNLKYFHIWLTLIKEIFDWHKTLNKNSRQNKNPLQ